MAKPLYVAVSTQKGGAGKTTLTAILASYFYYIRKVDLAVVDCDYPQWSLAQLRERDLRLSEKSEKIKKVVHETWKARGLSAYEIVKKLAGGCSRIRRNDVGMGHSSKYHFLRSPRNGKQRSRYQSAQKDGLHILSNDYRPVGV